VDASVVEGNTGTRTVTLTVTAANANWQTMSAAWATANGTATAGSDFVNASGTVSFTAGQVSRTFNITINGDAVNEGIETFAVNLTAPVNATIADAQGIVSITNDDGPTLAISDVSINETNAAGTATFTVSLSVANATTVTAAYATADATATAGADYVAAAGTVTFAPGVLTQTVPVAINGDTLDEVNETFVVNLTAPVNATILDAQGVATIVDEDPLPSIAIGNVTLIEGDSGTANAAFTLTLSAASGKTVTVAYATNNVTATAGADYVAATGTATFAPGTTSAVVDVIVNTDTVAELNETFQVNLTTPVNATVLDAQGIGTITNDDTTPGLSITDVAVFEGSSGTTTANVTVTVSLPSAQAITVSFATVDQTATAGTDYTAAAGTLTFLPGIVSQTVAISVTPDTVTEGLETFAVNLHTAVNASLLDAQGVVSIADDDALIPGLVAAYGFDENAGATAADATGNGHTGTIAGATWTTAGHTGNALSFDGVNDMVSVADSALLDVTRVTLMAWVRPTLTDNWRSAILKERTGGLAYALYAEDGAARPAAYVNLGQADDREAKGTLALTVNTWTHLTMTFDGTALRVYQNGVLVRTANFTGNIVASGSPLRIGGNAVWGEFYAGLMDDVRVFNRALTLEEIQTSMNTGVTP
jgi:serralysin